MASNAYYITCWVNPRTGKELIQRFMEEELMKDIFDMLSATDRVKNCLHSMKKDHEGMVLKNFIINSDDNERHVRELLPIIQRDFPEAELADWDYFYHSRKLNSNTIEFVK